MLKRHPCRDLSHMCTSDNSPNPSQENRDKKDRQKYQPAGPADLGYAGATPADRADARPPRIPAARDAGAHRALATGVLPEALKNHSELIDSVYAMILRVLSRDVSGSLHGNRTILIDHYPSFYQITEMPHVHHEGKSHRSNKDFGLVFLVKDYYIFLQSSVDLLVLNSTP